MSTKIAGVSAYVWGFGLLGAAALFWAFQSAPKPSQEPVTGKATPRTSARPTPVISSDHDTSYKAANDYLDAIRKVIAARYDKEKAESDLKSQVTAGRAQLKAMELSDAKSAYAAAVAKCEAAGSNLLRVERSGVEQNSIEITYYAGLGGLRNYGERVVATHFIKMEYRGITDPETRSLFDEYLRVAYKVTLDETLSDTYKRIEFPTYRLGDGALK